MYSIFFCTDLNVGEYTLYLFTQYEKNSVVHLMLQKFNAEYGAYQEWNRWFEYWNALVKT